MLGDKIKQSSYILMYMNEFFRFKYILIKFQEPHSSTVSVYGHGLVSWPDDNPSLGSKLVAV